MLFAKAMDKLGIEPGSPEAENLIFRTFVMNTHGDLRVEVHHNPPTVGKEGNQ